MSQAIMTWGLTRSLRWLLPGCPVKSAATVLGPHPVPTPFALPSNSFPLIPSAPSCLGSGCLVPEVEKHRLATSPETPSLLPFSSCGTGEKQGPEQGWCFSFHLHGDLAVTLYLGHWCLAQSLSDDFFHHYAEQCIKGQFELRGKVRITGSFFF